MSWSDAIANLDRTCLSTFGTPASYLSQAGGSPVSIQGIISPPPLMEDALPGSVVGVSVVYFFVRFTEDLNPRTGDQVILNGVHYDVGDPQVDSCGGCMLKLRRRS